jgi:hypothetical protein
LFEKRIKELALLLDEADLNEYQRTLVTEVFEITGAEQKKAAEALGQSVAVTELVMERPTIH